MQSTLPFYPTPSFENKICSPENLAERLITLARPLVFTNGCFDILHRGHVTYLAQARALGAALVLALNTDESVRRLGKGSDRPINPLSHRAAVMASLESVDLVTWFDDDTPFNLKRRSQFTVFDRQFIFQKFEVLDLLIIREVFHFLCQNRLNPPGDCLVTQKFTIAYRL